MNSPATGWHITGNPTASYSMTPFGQTLRGGNLAVGLVLQSGSSNCLVLSIGESYDPTDFIQVNICHLPTISYPLRPKTACCTGSWCQSVVVMCAENSVQVEYKLAQSPAGRVDSEGIPAIKDVGAAAPWRVPSNICVIAMLRTFCTQEEIILIISAHTGICCLLLSKNREVSQNPYNFFLRKTQYSINKPSKKTGQRLTL